MQEFADLLIQQQDYFWFLAILALVAALGLRLHRSSGNPMPGWMLWLAGGNLVMAVGELVAMAQPGQFQPRHPVNLPVDLAWGFILAAQTWGVLVPAGRSRKHWPWLAPLLAIAWWRHDHPWLATVILTALATAGLLRLLVRDPEQAGRGALWAALLALWFSPIGLGTGWLNNQILNHFSAALVGTAPAGGPLTSLTVGLRRWSITGSWGVWVALVFLGVALVWLFERKRQLPAGPEQREWRRFGALSLGWLVAGLFLAAVLSAWTRRIFEETTLNGAKLVAGLLDPADLNRAFGPVFDPKVTNPEAGPGARQATLSPEYWAAVAPIEKFLTLADDAARPKAVTTVILVERNGWINIAAVANGEAYQANVITVLDAALPGAPAKPGPHFLRPHQGALGTTIQARVPLFFSDGRLLGWLAVLLDPEEWQASQVQARLQAFAIVSLGLGLAFMGLMQRLKGLAHEAARREKELAQQADRTKTEFLARVSHELRTPIQSVLGYGELLQSAVQGEAARSRLGALRQHGQLMLRLVNDLLDLAALQSGRFHLAPKPTQVFELVRQTAESMRPRAAAKGLNYTVDVPPVSSDWRLADGERLRQVVLNLVANAIKFTDSGSVRVVFGPEDDGDVVLTVSDTGPGIPAGREKDLFRAFGRLEQTAAKEGTGLGLVLAAAICESMGGGIAVEKPARGACFVARFRLAGCEAPVETEFAPLRSLIGRNILVVDDNTLIRELFSTYLQEMGAICAVAADSGTALQLASSQAFDAVVLDLALPGLGGVEVARLLRLRAAPGLRIIGVSAHATADDRAQALAAGMDSFLTKPVELRALVEEIAAPRAASGSASPQLIGLAERLRAQFRTEAPVVEAALAAAVSERDWTTVRAKAHYMKNSADVMGLRRLSDACRDLETAAEQQQPLAAQSAVQECRAQLIEWR